MHACTRMPTSSSKPLEVYLDPSLGSSQLSPGLLLPFLLPSHSRVEISRMQRQSLSRLPQRRMGIRIPAQIGTEKSPWILQMNSLCNTSTSALSYSSLVHYSDSRPRRNTRRNVSSGLFEKPSRTHRRSNCRGSSKSMPLTDGCSLPNLSTTLSRRPYSRGKSVYLKAYSRRWRTPTSLRTSIPGDFASNTTCSTINLLLPSDALSREWKKGSMPHLALQHSPLISGRSC